MKIAGILAVFGLFVMGCGSDDGGAPNRYAGVVQWDCYEYVGSSCVCYGLDANSAMGVSGTNVRLVASCPATFPVCQSFIEDDSWMCECRAAPWTPVIGEDVQSIQSCPPT